MARPNKLTYKNGFTIIELLIVIAVIGILVTIVTVAYNGIQSGARDKSVLADLDTLDGIETDYGLKNGGVSLAWYSGNGANVSLSFTPSPGNIIDIVTNSTDYCIRAYNPSSANYKTLATAATKESTAGICTTLPVSAAAQVGTSGTPCPAGFIVVPGSATFGTSNFCVMKYEARNVGGIATSQASGTPWTSITQPNAITASAGACANCHLITEAEWLTIAQNVLSVSSNWSGGSVGSGYIYSGHNDNTPTGALTADTNDANGYSGETNTGGNQRRTLTLTNGQVIWDFAGNVWEWTQGFIAGGQQPGLSGQTSYTGTEWNNSSLLMNGLPAIDKPSYGTPSAVNWTTTQGIGLVYSNPSEPATRAFVRGGSWGSALYAGVSYVGTGSANTPDSSTGFRVTQ